MGRLRDLKFAVLDMCAPNRRFDIFDVSGSDSNDGDDGSRRRTEKRDNQMGVSRVVALLVTASGDSHRDVAEHASGYLRAHLESRKNCTTARKNPVVSSSSDDRREIGDGEETGRNNENGFGLTLLGDPLRLACELLFRALGDLVASNALVLQTQPNGAAVIGLGHSNTGGGGD